MMKSLKNILRQDKETYKIPKSVHDYIPINGIYADGQKTKSPFQAFASRWTRATERADFTSAECSSL